MTDSSLAKSVERLLSRLQQSGLLSDLELSDEDIVDTLWLACQMGVVEAKPQQTEPSQPKSDTEVREDKTGNVTSVDSKTDENKVIQIYSENTIEPEFKTSPQTKSLPFQAPAAPAIQNSLQISRVLRPLMRKVPSATKTILDEEATVTVIAEKRVFVPITKPEPERWLDLELIVEQSRSSFIWQETIDELRQILEIYGAFRSVRVWDLASDNTTQLQLVRRKKGKRTSKRQHSYRELIHSDGRGLVLLVSDCVSSIWQQGEIHRWLQQWSQKQPTAIMQLFPERMWDSTQLGVGRKLFASALIPGVTNPKLILQNLPAWIPINWQQALVLPVVNLEPEILKQWSRVVAGSGSAKISTYLFDLDFVAKQAKQEKTRAEVKTETSSQTAEAKIIVKRFLATASMTAQRLAGMMAAAPVDMRVVNLIRKTLLPEATPVHVAEVYMGGLLESKTEERSKVYQFRDGVRHLLNKAMAQYETESVLDTISRYIAEEIDRPIRSFTALLALLPTFSEEEQEQILPFAEVAVEVLENLGGKYAEFAKEVAANINGPIKPEPKKEESEADTTPELKTLTFETATYFESEFEICTFQVATIEKGLNTGKNIKWLFQGNNQYYRMVDAIRDLEELYWPVVRYFKEMAIQDGVLFWVSGKEAGIYAIAEIIELSEKSKEVPPLDYWIDKSRLEDKISNRPKARIRFINKLLEKPLLKEKLRHDNILKNLSVIQNPRNSCFKVTLEESKRINELIQVLDLIVKTETKQVQYFTEKLGDGVLLDMISIPGGSFIMGAPEEELESSNRERPQHKVTVPSFYMGRYPITQAQWKEVAGWEQVERKLDSDPSRFKENYEGIDRWNRPVEHISWDDAKEFCNRLSQKTGKEYRLPTEAEWEYACRSVVSHQSSVTSQELTSEELTVEEWNEKYNQPFHFGETISTELANYDGNSTYGEGVKGQYREQTTPVGYFKVANNFGLYDMHGQVWEWCEDDWHENYENASPDGSAWSAKSSTKVIRGGSWFNYPHRCRSAIRLNNLRVDRITDIGFRVVCVAPFQ